MSLIYSVFLWGFLLNISSLSAVNIHILTHMAVYSIFDCVECGMILSQSLRGLGEQSLTWATEVQPNRQGKEGLAQY